MSKRLAVFVVSLIVAGWLQGQAPSFTAAGFVNAASSAAHSPPAVARGEIVTIFGTNLSTSTQFIPLGSPNPTQIAGSQTRVFFGNIAAPLLYVSSSLVNLQVPYELPDSLATVDVTVRNELGASTAVNILVVPQDPGIYAVLRADNTVLAPGAVANAGDILNILVGGVGEVLPPLPSGTPAPTSPAYNSVIAPVVTVNGVPAPVITSTLNPGLVGVYIVRVAVPPGGSGPINVGISKSTAANIAGGSTGVSASGIPYSVAGHTIISGGFYSPLNTGQSTSADGATAPSDAVIPSSCRPSMTIYSFVNTAETFNLVQVSPVAGQTNWSTTGPPIIGCNTAAWSSGAAQTCTAAASSNTPAGAVVTLTSSAPATGGFLIGFSCQ
jgi:uncharacterized protein (TIGR03437 family)